MSISSSKLAYTALAFCLFVASGFQLFAAENRFRVISKRNAFNLSNDPPKRQDAGPPPEPPKSEDIKLTGIYRHKGVERAALALIDPKKKSDPPKYLELAAGEKQDRIEIVSIDKKTGKVTLKDLGALRRLSFETDAFKTSVSKAPSRSSSSKSSSKSSSSRSSSSSESAKRAAEMKAAEERKKREEAARSAISSRLSNMSSQEREQLRERMRSRYSNGGGDRNDRDRSDDGRRGGDSRRGRGR